MHSFFRASRPALASSNVFLDSSSPVLASSSAFDTLQSALFVHTLSQKEPRSKAPAEAEPEADAEDVAAPLFPHPPPAAKAIHRRTPAR